LTGIPVAKRKTKLEETAAAAAVAAVAAAQDAADDVTELGELEAAELTEEVLEGLRRLESPGTKILWRVYCDVPAEGKREGFVAKLRTDQLDEALFKKRYGPGEYRVVGKGADGQYVRGAHAVIKISDIDDPGSPGSGGGAQDAVSLVREMRAADEARAAKRSEELKGYATILAAPAATIAAALLTRRPSLDVPALIAALRPQQSSLGELTQALTNLNELQRGKDSGGSGVELVLKVLEKVQDLPQIGGGGEGGWLGFIRDVIRETAPHARELLTQLSQQRQQPPGLPAPGTAPPPLLPPSTPQTTSGANGATPPPSSPSVASSDSPSAPSAPASEADAMLAAVQPWLRRKAEDLHEWAAGNLDPELCGEMLLASVPKPFRSLMSAPELAELLQRADWFQQLTAFYPPLAPYAAWLDDVRSTVLQILQDEIAEATGAPPPPETPERPQ
jgi:hypothetical protein